MVQISRFSAIAAAAAMAFQASADDLTLITDGGVLPSSWEWSDSSAWSPEGGSLENANLTISGVAESPAGSTITGGLTLGDIDILVGDNGNSANALRVDTVGADVNFGTLTIANNGFTQTVIVSTQSDTPATGKWIGDTINIISDGVNRQTVTLSPNNPHLTLSGGVNITNNSAIDSAIIQGQTQISGVITMKAAGSAEGARLALNMWNMNFGGLSDGGVAANHVISFNWGGTINLYNAADYSWRGRFEVEGGENINISKNGVGSQRFEVTGIKNHFGNIRANEGLLEIDASAISTLFANNLYVNGGSFKNVGNLNVGALTLMRGTIVLGNDTGMIIVDGNLSKGDAPEDAGKISIDFSELTASGEYTLIEVLGDIIDFDREDALADFDLINLVEGANAELIWDGNSLVLSYTVPEPAAVAAILGAAALGFAALRRRK